MRPTGDGGPSAKRARWPADDDGGGGTCKTEVDGDQSDTDESALPIDVLRAIVDDGEEAAPSPSAGGGTAPRRRRQTDARLEHAVRLAHWIERRRNATAAEFDAPMPELRCPTGVAPLSAAERDAANSLDAAGLRQLCGRALALLCAHAGFELVTSAALDTLSALLVDYVRRVAGEMRLSDELRRHGVERAFSTPLQGALCCAAAVRRPVGEHLVAFYETRVLGAHAAALESARRLQHEQQHK